MILQLQQGKSEHALVIRLFDNTLQEYVKVFSIIFTLALLTRQTIDYK